MRHLKLFEEFKGKITDEADIVYKDNRILVIVPKTPEATKKYSRNTMWCSNSKSGFYGHIVTANLFRIHFKDGYKLRLTWDYLPWDGGYSGGTHWGQGGKLNGEKLSYQYIRPKDENNPFDFDYNKEDDRQEMVNRIKSLPEEAKRKIIEYQESHSKDKTDILNKMYSDIQSIKVVYVDDSTPKNANGRYKKLIIKCKKDGKTFDVDSSFYEGGSSHINIYGISDEMCSGAGDYRKSGIEDYLYDKTMDWLKRNKKELYTEIKKLQTQDEEVQ